MTLLLFLLNIAARVAVMIVGLLVLTRQLPLFPTDTSMNEMFGVIVALFGLYRLIQYLSLRTKDHDENT
ncbi:MAG: hypothetical protein RIR53_1215 [Bacteroidota bacterium]|jgi:uncharacterized membrane protein YcaP (DUF421 family)